MEFVRKRLLFLVFLLVIYCVYFLTHLPHTAPPTVLGTSANLFLFEQPQSGKDPLLSAISSAQKEVDVEVYLLSDSDVIASLLGACQRGIVVQVILEEHPFGGGNSNQKTEQLLQDSCVHLQWSNPSFSLTHEKTVAIDSSEVFILNQNLTASSFSKNREYDIIDRNALDIEEIKNIFNADWHRSSVSLSDENLVVSPVNSRDKLTALINSEVQTLSIETEVIDDPQIITLLSQKAKNTQVQLLIPSFSQVGANKKNAVQLQSSGVEVKTLRSPYIHAKLILADGKKAYVGSVNLTAQSMDANREVGILIAQQDIVAQLNQDFHSDWEKANPLP